MSIEIRTTSPEEYRDAAGAVSTALMFPPPSDEQWERSRPSWDEMPSVSAWDGDRCVGHAGQFLVDTTVPGGVRLPTGAVSRVGVLTSHRRQGVATGLMQALIRDAVQRGLALMSLRASEATIYERYGFAMAGEYCQGELLPERARPVRGAAEGGSIRILDPDDILVTVMPIYDRCAHRRAGCISRPASFWRRLFRSALDQSSATFVAVHADADGDDDGFVLYETAWLDDDSVDAGGRGTVHELWGADDAAELALWQYICEVDLVRRWSVRSRPVDDLIRRAARDTRAARITSVVDEQWLRIIDTEVALAVRSYQPVEGSVVIRVTDPFLPRNDGTWRVSADDAIRCHDDADIVTDIVGLSMVYLGGPSWSEAAALGLAEVRDPWMLDLADALFATTSLPYCGTFF